MNIALDSKLLITCDEITFPMPFGLDYLIYLEAVVKNLYPTKALRCCKHKIQFVTSNLNQVRQIIIEEEFFQLLFHQFDESLIAVDPLDQHVFPGVQH